MRLASSRGVLGLLGGLLFAVTVATTATVLDVTRQSVSTTDGLILSVKLAVLVAPSIGLLALAWRLDPDDVGGYRSVGKWSLLVGVAVAGTAVVAGVKPSVSTPVPSFVHVLTGLSVGCLLGALIGKHAEDARVNAETAAENARIARERRDDFVFLNQLLRHHVLNAVTIIRGRADLLVKQSRDGEREHLLTIRERSDRIASLVETVQTVAKALSEDSPTTAVDLKAVLETVATDYRTDAGDASVSIDVPPETYVASNGAVAAVFDQLVGNALTHNEAETPRVRIEAERDGDVVRVTVADNGSGFSETEREMAFEPGDAGDSGLGLYAVNVLVTDCGGDVEIRDTAEGSSVVVTLPASSPPRTA